MHTTMNKLSKISLVTFLVLFISPLLATVAMANGQLIIPEPPIPRPRFQPLILERQEVNTTIDNQIAKTHIKQVWRNNNHMQLEGEFLFPLPSDRATMSNFVLWMDGKRLSFETLEAGKARGIYENIVRQVRDPGLLEHVSDGLLKCRIFPIPALGTKEIELEYREVLTKDSTLTRYAFPLGIKGLPQPISTLLINVEINSSSSMGQVYSPTHDVAIDMRDSRHARVTLEKSHYMPTREFVLLMSHPNNEFGVDLITHKVSGEDGYFLGMISPRFDYEASNQKHIPKDFLFILDTSGSMEGKKIDQAKEALRYIIRNLNPEDRFGLINFSSEVHKFRDELVPASKNKQAIEYIDTLSAVGGTYIDGALKEGLSFVGGGGKRPFYMIFLTDGLPTVGEQNIDRICANAKNANERDARIFTFGVGDDVNIPFIDRIATENGGDYANAAPTEDIEVPLSNLYQKIKSPVLTDLEIEIDGVKIFDFYPKELPDLFKGGQLVVTGRYTGSGSASIRLTGKLGGGSDRTFEYKAKFSSSGSNDFIPPLWANRKVGYLLNQIRLYGENQESMDQIIKLAKRFGIITPYTSYLVLEDGMIPPPMPLREGFAPDDHWSYSGRGGAAYNVLSAPQGESAQRASKSLQKQEHAADLDSVSYEEAEAYGVQVQQVQNKTFTQSGSDIYWVDTEYDPEEKLEEVEIEFMSDEYFDLLDKYPDIADYLSVGENIKIVWDNQLFIIQAGDSTD